MGSQWRDRQNVVTPHLSVFSFTGGSVALKRLSTTSILVSVALACAGLTFAQSGAQGQIQHVLVRDVVKQDVKSGKQVEVILSSPIAFLPGELQRERFTLPVSDSRWSLMSSADHGNTYSEPLMQSVTVSKTGKLVTGKVTSPSSTYRTVRWSVTTVKTDESLKLSFRVKVK